MNAPSKDGNQPISDIHCVPKQVTASSLSEAIKSLPPTGIAVFQQRFAEVYDDIADALERKVGRKEIITTLAEHGLKLHHTQFSALLRAEAVRRGDAVKLEVTR
ncbi:hypothetical protein [Thauera sinica]|uniref:Uncharacterized protein n=1 Tax=Thauera sinica TaxID=2665146 RepID=A0ABW1AS07_9RHOO|nr:hypothetical protein [Thauera sp. K11]